MTPTTRRDGKSMTKNIKNNYLLWMNNILQVKTAEKSIAEVSFSWPLMAAKFQTGNNSALCCNEYHAGGVWQQQSRLATAVSTGNSSLYWQQQFRLATAVSTGWDWRWRPCTATVLYCLYCSSAALFALQQCCTVCTATVMYCLHYSCAALFALQQCCTVCTTAVLHCLHYSSAALFALQQCCTVCAATVLYCLHYSSAVLFALQQCCTVCTTTVLYCLH